LNSPIDKIDYTQIKLAIEFLGNKIISKNSIFPTQFFSKIFPINEFFEDLIKTFFQSLIQRIINHRNLAFEIQSVPLLQIQKNYEVEKKDVDLSFNFLNEYDYDDITEEHLGIFYEYFLNFSPKYTYKRLFHLENQNVFRKGTGSYYTPNFIVKQIVAKNLSLIVDNIKNREELDKNEKETALLEIKICDPACGGGIFLLSSLNYLSNQLSEIKYGTTMISDEIKVTDCQLVLKNCIYGIDKNQFALMIAKLSLCLKGNTTTFISEINQHLKFGDSLIDNSLFDNEFIKFDSIITNPPYLSSKVIPQDYKKELKSKFLTALNQFDLYTIFIEHSINILKEKGIASFLIPDSFLGRSSFQPIRQFILNDFRILSIFQLNSVFKNVSVSNIIISIKKMQPLKDTEIKFVKLKDSNNFNSIEDNTIVIPQKYFLTLPNNKILPIDQPKREFINVLKKKCFSFDKIISVHRGEEIGKKTEFLEKFAKQNNCRILFGKDIASFKISHSSHYIPIKKIRKPKQYFHQKIMLRQLGDHINAMIDEKGEFVTVQAVYNIQLLSKNYDIYYILGLLNSDFMNGYYDLLFKGKKLFPRILLENIKELPIFPATLEQQLPISELVKKIIMFKAKKKNVDKLLENLNQSIQNLLNS
jgi:adenine-specific DNA-methyltransferase